MSRFQLPNVILWIALPALLAPAGCKPAGAADAPGAGGAAAVPVQVAVAVRRDVPRSITSIGAAQPLRSVTVESQVDGVIAAIHFREGDDVKTGDLLVSLDRRPYENSLRMAEANLANARAENDQARADANRYSQLDREKAISKEQYTQVMTKLETTQAQIQAAAATVANAQLQLGYTEIRAPFDGRTGQLLRHKGALVRANDPGSALVTLNQISPITVAYTVPEGDLTDIREAQAGGDIAVTVENDSTGLVLHGGRLVFMDNTIDPATGTITLKALFPNEHHRLWPGQFVHVTTQTGVDRDAVVVPSTAVMAGQSGSTAYVVQPDHTVELREVKVRRIAGDLTLIASGIQAGDTVVTDGQLRLLPGVKVKAVTLEGGAPAGS